MKRPATPAPVKKREVDDRSASIVAMHTEGKTQKQIATEFGISVERVPQIIASALRSARGAGSHARKLTLTGRRTG